MLVLGLFMVRSEPTFLNFLVRLHTSNSKLAPKLTQHIKVGYFGHTETILAFFHLVIGLNFNISIEAHNKVAWILF